MPTMLHAALRAAGGLALGEAPLPNPAPDWMSHKSWGELCRASDLGPDWEGLAAHVAGMCVCVLESPPPSGNNTLMLQPPANTVQEAHS